MSTQTTGRIGPYFTVSHSANISQQLSQLDILHGKRCKDFCLFFFDKKEDFGKGSSIKDVRAEGEGVMQKWTNAVTL